MVLTSLFDNEADVTDNGYLQVNSDGNMLIGSEVTWTTAQDNGSIMAMYDLDVTTAFGTSDTGVHEKYVLVDLRRSYNDVLITCYYSVHDAGANSAKVTLQHSTDNATWTDVSNKSLTSAGELFKNYSGVITKIRYFRMKTEQFVGTTGSGGNLYWLNINRS